MHEVYMTERRQTADLRGRGSHKETITGSKTLTWESVWHLSDTYKKGVRIALIL